MTSSTKPIPMNSDAEEAWDQSAQSRPADLLAGIVAAAREPGTVREKATGFLDVVTEHIGCLSASLTVGVAGDEIELVCGGDVAGVDAWDETLRSTALEARSHERSITRIFGPDGTPQHAVIACTIDSAGGAPFGAIAVLVRCSDINQAERIQLQLRAGCLQIATELTRRVTSRSVVEMSDIARVYTRAGQFRSIQQFAFTIANSARQRFDCDQAAIGLVRDDKVRVVCISGLDSVKARSPGVLKIEQAMGECADACCPVVAQHRDRWEDDGLAEEGLLHQAWRASVNGASVMSIPIDAGDEPVAIVSFRRSDQKPFNAEDIEAAKKLLVPLAGAIPLVTRATRPLHRHATDSARSVATWCMGPKTVRRKMFVAAAILAVAWGAMGTRMYRVSVPAVVVAEREQVVSAPFDGRVESVLLRSGDRVQAGQTILTMDTSALELERRDLAAERSNALLRLSGGMAAGDPSAASIAQSEIQSIDARLRRVEQQLEDANVRAPHAGIVIAPELADLPGRVIATGAPLISIIEHGSMSLELRVPQSRVSDMVEGNRLRFASHARPELPGFSTLGKLAPSSVQRNGDSVFIADAELPDDQAWLRPGMNGVAMIEVGERPNWWLAVHRIMDKARLRFWFD